MKNLPVKLQHKLDYREENNALRQLPSNNTSVDFSSNDYLGFSKSAAIFENTYEFLKGHNITQNGATGSRLLSGNHPLFNVLESTLSNFHNCDAALIFNSGYDANVGFFSSVPQRGNIILYDEYIHASIRDGITMSNAKAYKFKHNNLEDLEKRCEIEHNRSHSETTIYIVTESVFSMDGDIPDLLSITQISKKYDALLVIDEAHATGVFGNKGEGLVQYHGLEEAIFARIVTFGKAIGCHGAAILGSSSLRDFLINFSRSFIYTTALPPHSLAAIHSAYNELITTPNRQRLIENIKYFRDQVFKIKLNDQFIPSDSAIQSCIINGNDHVKDVANKLQENNFDVKPILSPTVPEGQERLRFCLHSYNTEKEIREVLQLLTTFV